MAMGSRPLASTAERDAMDAIDAMDAMDAMDAIEKPGQRPGSRQNQLRR